jgi:hypothetical protein
MPDRPDASRAPVSPEPDGRPGGGHGPGTPVLISKVRLVGSLGGLVTMEWVLVTAPDRAWADAFERSPAKRRGSPAFVSGGCGQPLVHEGAAIRWSVPYEDLNGAAAYVLESVVYANSRTRPEAARSGVPAGPARSSRPPQ